jgi:integrase
MAKRLTTVAIEQAKPGPARREIADGGCPGLYLVIQPGGAKSWALRFRSPVERDKHGQRAAKKLTLGPLATDVGDGEPQIGHPLTLTQARKLATAALEQVDRKIDPTHTRREEKAKAKQEAAAGDNTVDAAMVEFLKRYKGRKKQGLRESTRRLTAMYLGLKPDPEKPGEWKTAGNGVLKRWSGRPLASITKRDAIVLLDDRVDAGHGVTANRTLTNLKTFFGWCVKRDMLTASPVAVLDAPAEEKSRERRLDDAELAAVWRAAEADGYPFGDLIRLLVLTGARRDELREAMWSEFDLDAATWLLPAVRSKNGREHLVPLSPLAVDILRGMPRIAGRGLLYTLNGDTPISDLSKRKRRLDEASKVTGWTPHDLRRTLASGLQALGFSVEVVEAVLNHKSGTLRGVAGVYARYSYQAEKTAALAAWARHLDGLVNAGVRAIARRRRGAK